MAEENLPEPKAALPALQPGPPEQERPNRRIGQWFLLVVAVVALSAALVYVILQFLTPAEDPGAREVPRNERPGLDGVIATEMPPEQLIVGDCLRGFTGPLDLQTVVTCDSSHNAQLIGTFTLEHDSFPGADALLTESEDLCKSVAIDPSAGLDSTWTYHFSRPSQSTWSEGDRLVSCFLSLNSGTVRSSLLPEAEQS
ncbi:hypothetical protein GCM10027417_01110 [Glutamicibacter endophyticus]